MRVAVLAVRAFIRAFLRFVSRGFLGLGEVIIGGLLVRGIFMNVFLFCLAAIHIVSMYFIKPT